MREPTIRPARGMRRWTTGLVIAVAAAAFLGSWGTNQEPAEGGMGLPRTQPGESYPGERREIIGTFVVADNGCFNVRVDGEEHFVIWPRGEHAGEAVRLSPSEELRDGDTVRGRGALTPVAPLVADDGGYWANAIGFCAPDAEEVLVFDEVDRD